MLIGRLVRRNFSGWSSVQVRNAFLDYFRGINYELVKGSSVNPNGLEPGISKNKDLHFVNAGMNQFKNIILGEYPELSSTRVCNVQNCIRMNDVDFVGKDGTHHTHFEMLGSWNFNQDKLDKFSACSSAWKLLTQEFKISPNNLYISFFDGNSEVPRDVETLEVWRQIGVPDSHIQGMGIEDNFWQMGLSGPCGPCTEIYYKDKDGNLTEIWNLVFMEYNRPSQSSLLERLDKTHLDTGMGLERLCAVLNAQNNNYATDLFMPIINSITEKYPGRFQTYSHSFSPENKNDQYLRILADHSRMLVVSCFDGLYPAKSPKVRNVLHNMYKICSEVFPNKNEYNQTISDVILHSCAAAAYQVLEPVNSGIHAFVTGNKFQSVISNELYRFYKSDINNYKRRSDIIKYFPDMDATKYKNLQLNKGTMPAFTMLSKSKDKEKISGELAFSLYESTGVTKDEIAEIASIIHRKFDSREFDEYFELTRNKSKKGTEANIINRLKSRLKDVPPTDDSFKYDYTRESDEYNFPSIDAQVLKIFDLGTFEEVESLHDLKKEIALIVDRTNFFGEAGGQAGDIGDFMGHNVHFKIKNTIIVPISKDKSCVAHIGNLFGGVLKKGSSGKMTLNEDHRTNLMNNHTGVHLLNSVVQDLYPDVHQCFSKVTTEGFEIEFMMYNDLNSEDLLEIQIRINKLIKENHPIQRHASANITNFKSENPDIKVVTLPGYFYPESSSLVQSPLMTEACCGTHVFKSGELGILAISNMKTTASSKTFYGCTRNLAGVLHSNTNPFLETIVNFGQKLESYHKSDKILKVDKMTDIKNIAKTYRYKRNVTYVVKHAVNELLSDMLESLDSKQAQLKESKSKETSQNLLDLVNNLRDDNKDSDMILGEIQTSASDEQLKKVISKKYERKKNAKIFILHVVRNKQDDLENCIFVSNVTPKIKSKLSKYVKKKFADSCKLNKYGVFYYGKNATVKDVENLMKIIQDFFNFSTDISNKEEVIN